MEVLSDFINRTQRTLDKIKLSIALGATFKDIQNLVTRLDKDTADFKATLAEIKGK